eukprot:345794-Hanusia_phi.AAC.3
MGRGGPEEAQHGLHGHEPAEPARQGRHRLALLLCAVVVSVQKVDAAARRLEDVRQEAGGDQQAVEAGAREGDHDDGGGPTGDQPHRGAREHSAGRVTEGIPVSARGQFDRPWMCIRGPRRIGGDQRSNVAFVVCSQSRRDGPIRTAGAYCRNVPDVHSKPEASGFRKVKTVSFPSSLHKLEMIACEHNHAGLHRGGRGPRAAGCRRLLSVHTVRAATVSYHHDDAGTVIAQTVTAVQYSARGSAAPRWPGPAAGGPAGSLSPAGPRLSLPRSRLVKFRPRPGCSLPLVSHSVGPGPAAPLRGQFSQDGPCDRIINRRWRHLNCVTDHRTVVRFSSLLSVRLAKFSFISKSGAGAGNSGTHDRRGPK